MFDTRACFDVGNVFDTCARIDKRKILNTCALSDYMEICLILVHVLIILMCLQCVHVLGIEYMYMLLVHVSLLYEFTIGARLVNLSVHVTYFDLSINSF